MGEKEWNRELSDESSDERPGWLQQNLLSCLERTILDFLFSLWTHLRKASLLYEHLFKRAPEQVSRKWEEARGFPRADDGDSLTAH